MKRIPFTKEMIARARARAKEMGSIKNSITKGGGNVAGFLGEEAFCAYTGASAIGSKDHDVVLNNERIEVKTKRRTVAPEPNYDVSVATTSTHQNPDKYAFISLEFGETITKRNGQKAYKDLKNVWYVGSKDAEEYFKEAAKWDKGDVDKSNDFTTLQDMYNLPISELEELDTPKPEVDESKVYNFEDSNVIGAKGEELIIPLLQNKYPDKAIKDVRDIGKYRKKDIDFLLMNSDNTVYKSIELKTDTYYDGEKISWLEAKERKIQASQNLMVETISHVLYRTPGCLVKTEADQIYYYYINQDKIYVLDREPFQKWFKQELPKHKARTPATLNKDKSRYTYLTTEGGSKVRRKLKNSDNTWWRKPVLNENKLTINYAVPKKDIEGQPFLLETIKLEEKKDAKS